MNDAPEWWVTPRKISVLVDSPSWILPYAQLLVESLNQSGDTAVLCRSQEEVGAGSVTFLLGCTQITPPEVLALNRRNLVVHASDLPNGRGFSPWTWLAIEGKTENPVCLIDAAHKVDSGNVVYRDKIQFEGHELIDELRNRLGEFTIDLCLRFLAEKTPPHGDPKQGAPSTYRRRYPADSELDPHRNIAKQFDLLRTVDNLKYPAFFNFREHRFKITIEKLPSEQNKERPSQ